MVRSSDIRIRKKALGLFLLGAVLGTTLALPTRAGTADNDIAIEVTVEVPTSIQIEVLQPLRFGIEGENADWRVTGEGRLAVAIVTNSGGGAVAAVGHWRTCQSRGCATGRSLQIVEGGRGRSGHVTLPRGRYKLHLVGDGAPITFFGSFPSGSVLLGKSTEIRVGINSTKESAGLDSMTLQADQPSLAVVAVAASASLEAEVGTCYRSDGGVVLAHAAMLGAPCRETGGKGGSVHSFNTFPGGRVDLSTYDVRMIGVGETLAGFGRAVGGGNVSHLSALLRF